MRILVDLQGAQSTGSRHRGIGRYSLSLLTALLRCRGEHEISVLLNASFRESASELRSGLADVVPVEQIFSFSPVEGSAYSPQTPHTRFKRQASEAAREAVIEEIAPDCTLVTSLFEGLGDPVVTSVRALSDRPTAVILYDLIPYEFADHYLADPTTRAWYLSKLGHLRRADLALTISESTRKQGIDLGALDSSRLLNISTAVGDEFHHAPGSDADWERLRIAHGISGDFILYTGGHDFRKNIERLIEAYSGLPRHIRTSVQLVVVCTIEAAAKERYLAVADRLGVSRASVVFTGYVPHEDLLALYARCKLFTFPSFAEGFGLPVLEAMKCGAVVIGSNRSSIPEVVGIKEALFDPFDPNSIRDKIAEGLTNDAFRRRLATHFAKQSELFSWDRTAKKALSALSEIANSSAKSSGATFAGWPSEKRPHTPPAARRQDPKLHLAHVSPLPPLRSGIATYVAELLPDLADYYSLVLVSSGKDVPEWWAELDLPIRSPKWLLEHASDFDRVVYHFGNSEFHDYMPDLLERVPGVVVLHDFFLGGLQNFREAARGHPHALRDSLLLSHGYGAVVDLGRMRKARIDGLPASYGVLARAKGTLVHSSSVVELARAFYGDSVAEELLVAPLAQGRPSLPARNTAREELGIGVEDFVVCSFGFVHERKLSAQIAAGWTEFKRRNAGGAGSERLFFVGAADELNSNQAMSAGPGDGSMRIAGWVDDAVYRQYLSAADVAVQLRADNRGESSKAVLECLARGLATVVSTTGSFAEFPDDCVLKLPVNATAADVSRAIEVLWRDRTLRTAYGDRAIRHVQSKHSSAQVARRYHDHIEEIYRRPASLLSCAWNRAIDENWPVGSTAWREAAAALGKQINGGPRRPQHLVLIDPSSAGSDIPREALEIRPIPVQPVYFDGSATLRHATRLAAAALGLDPAGLYDDMVELKRGDVIETQSGRAPIVINFSNSDPQSLQDMIRGSVPDA